LDGCNLSGNQAANGGGANGGYLTNCLVMSNSASNFAGGLYSGGASNCTFVGNQSGISGGGADSATLNGCILSNNLSLLHGGGASVSILTNCLLIGNYAAGSGGGGGQCSMTRCTIISNTASDGGGISSLGTNNACVLISNYASNKGGGAYAATFNNCLIQGNQASDGGGANNATLNNCLVVGNQATNGGGTYAATLNNCTVVGNVGDLTGGILLGTASNCISYYNSASDIPYNYLGSATSLNYCCTPDALPGGVGNVTNAPFFINQAGGNFRLQTNSPCINAGTNVAASGTTDMDGRPRIIAGTVDIGAYEFQGPGTGEFFGWLQQFGLGTDGSADYTDNDLDGMNNWQEWRAGTIPTNAASRLLMLNTQPGASNVVVTWQSVTNRSYYLQRAAVLTAQPVFAPLATNIVGQAGLTSYTDTNAVGLGPYFYRVGVQ
jgi:hypothetical protein